MDFSRQDVCDFLIDEILNIVLIETTSAWNLRNLTTDDHWILSFTIGGEADYFWDGKTRRVRKGDTIFFQQGFSRSAKSRPQNPWKFIVVKFRLAGLDDKSLEKLKQIPNILPDVRQAVEPLFLEAETLWRGKRPGYILRCKALLYSIIYNLLRDAGQLFDITQPHYSEMAKVLVMIRENRGKNFSVQELARAVSLSPSYFRTLFKNYTGYSVIQYQNFLKVSQARDLMLSGNYNVNEAAAQVGIDDLYYFSRLFKQVTGASPSAFLPR